MTFREKVEKQLPIKGGHSHLADAVVSDILASFDYDFIWIDGEHTALMPQDIYHHILAVHKAGKAAVVRVPVTDLTFTKKIVEMDVDGIVFPMVRDAEHAKELLDMTLYPPVGKRGCGPKGAVRYGIDNEADFYVNGHKKMCRFVQIEQKSAALDAKRIAKIPYVDGCVLGMHDLSGSIGRLGDVFCDENVKLAQYAIDAFRAEGKTVGVSTCATDVETLKRYFDMGVNMISAGADFEYIVKGGRETVANLTEAMK